MLHIYHGDGKGKTTAAAGLCLRAAGHGIPVLFAQFLKDSNSGELEGLRRLPGVSILHPTVFYGFYSSMTEEEKEKTRQSYALFMEQIRLRLCDCGCGGSAPVEGGIKRLAVLDEVLHAVNMKLVEEDVLVSLIAECPGDTELVLTGRDPSERLLSCADYVTEMRKVKHPYDKGIAARLGIEY